MIAAGIDCGAKNTKTVVLKDGEIIGSGIVLTGFDQSEAVKASLDMALNDAGISREDLSKIGGTGSGSKSITEADLKVNDIKAMTAAAHYFFPNARTVADVGTEAARAAKCDETGNVVDFAVNEKCAAGAGAFIEAMGRALETPLEEMGPLALSSDNPIPLNAQCTIFAESEVVGLIHGKTSKEDISRAIHDAMAGRIVSMIRRIGVNPDIVMIGGVAYNPGFVAALRRELGVEQVYIPEKPEFASAVGAAVVAAKEAASGESDSVEGCVAETDAGITVGRKPTKRPQALGVAGPIESRNVENVPTAEGKMREYWRWRETNWIDPDIKWEDATFITVGIDVGSVSSQAVVMADGRMYAYGNMRTGSDSPNSARNALKFALEDTSLTEEGIHYTIGTGYGRVNVPMADRTVTEIACHARGANFIYGNTVRTVLDVGGQDIKVIRCDDNGKVTNFLMNDKCAAGTGRGMEVFADLLSVPIGDVGDRSFEIDREPTPVSSTCVIYAKSEATGLLRKGWKTNEVLAAYCSAMADRIYSLLERVGVEPDFAITGGMAKNRGVIDRLKRKMGLEPLKTTWDTQLAGAVGAALFGYALCQKGKGKK